MRDERMAIHFDHRGLGLHPIEVNVDGAGAVGYCGDQLEGRPQSTCSRERNGMAAEVEGFLRVAGEQQRHVEVNGGRVTR